MLGVRTHPENVSLAIMGIWCNEGTVAKQLFVIKLQWEEGILSLYGDCVGPEVRVSKHSCSQNISIWAS